MKPISGAPRHFPMYRLLRTLLLIAGLLPAISTQAATCDNPERLKFSFVPQGDVRHDSEAFRPLLARLQRALGKPVSIVAPASYGAVIEGLLAGNIDLALLGPASYAAAKKTDSGITAFASFAKKGGAFDDDGRFYHSLLVTRSDSRFTDIAALRGASLALTDPNSTSGYVVPRHFFPQASGQAFDRFFGKIVFTGSHDRAGLAVRNGQIDAAFVASFHLSDLVRTGLAKADDFRVLWRSAALPREPFVYRQRLCAGIKAQIVSVFLKHSDEENRSLLNRLNAKSFVPVGDDDYRLIRELY